MYYSIYNWGIDFIRHWRPIRLWGPRPLSSIPFILWSSNCPRALLPSLWSEIDCLSRRRRGAILLRGGKDSGERSYTNWDKCAFTSQWLTFNLICKKFIWQELNESCLKILLYQSYSMFQQRHNKGIKSLKKDGTREEDNVYKPLKIAHVFRGCVRIWTLLRQPGSHDQWKPPPEESRAGWAAGPAAWCRRRRTIAGDDDDEASNMRGKSKKINSIFFPSVGIIAWILCLLALLSDISPCPFRWMHLASYFHKSFTPFSRRWQNYVGAGQEHVIWIISNKTMPTSHPTYLITNLLFHLLLKSYLD